MTKVVMVGGHVLIERISVPKKCVILRREIFQLLDLKRKLHNSTVGKHFNTEVHEFSKQMRSGTRIFGTPLFIFFSI